jgi:hypothetical protein
LYNHGYRENRECMSQDSERDWLCRSARCVGTYRCIGYTEYKQVFVQCFADILSPVLLASSIMNTSETIS